jgi:hypothetical protein
LDRVGELERVRGLERTGEYLELVWSPFNRVVWQRCDGCSSTMMGVAALMYVPRRGMKASSTSDISQLK